MQKAELRDEHGEKNCRQKACSVSEAEIEDKLVGLAGHTSGSNRRQEGSARQQVTKDI